MAWGMRTAGRDLRLRGRLRTETDEMEEHLRGLGYIE